MTDYLEMEPVPLTTSEVVEQMRERHEKVISALNDSQVLARSAEVSGLSEAFLREMFQAMLLEARAKIDEYSAEYAASEPELCPPMLEVPMPPRQLPPSNEMDLD